MHNIAFVRNRFLPPSETFIYEELKNIKKYAPIVFTRKKMNADRFPYSKIKLLHDEPARVASSFAANHIRLIHARFGNAGTELIKVKKKLRLPMLTSFHGYDVPLRRTVNNDPYLKKLPALFRAGDLFTVPCYHMKKKLIRRGCPAYKIKIMYSGIDLNKFFYAKRESKTDGIVFIAVGRLNEKKGFFYLIKAFKKVHERYPKSRLIIVGEGKERGALIRLISRLRLTEAVQLIGLAYPGQISNLLHHADIFCLPSITTKDGNQEGIPNAIKEAMATGLPVIATRHAGIPELVTHKLEGLLVPERSVTSLAAKMKYLIERPQLRSRMGRRGREKVERNFDSAKQVKRLEQIYQMLIRKGRTFHG